MAESRYELSMADLKRVTAEERLLRGTDGGVRAVFLGSFSVAA